MFQVLGMRRVKDTDPQEFEIQLRDTENTTRGYFMTTKYGTEAELRTRLKEAGMPEGDIHRLFLQAS
jgi:hypothetical protein